MSKYSSRRDDGSGACLPQALVTRTQYRPLHPTSVLHSIACKIKMRVAYRLTGDRIAYHIDWLFIMKRVGDLI